MNRPVEETRFIEETRMTATLPGLDVEIVYRADRATPAETVTIGLRAVPGFEAAGRLAANPMLFLALAQAGPFLMWREAMRLAWRPWLLAAGSLLPDPKGQRGDGGRR